MSKYDKINPKHYNDVAITPIDVIEDWDLDFCLGNAVKYICRAGAKPGEDELVDLEKALWYLQRKVNALKAFKKDYEAVEEDSRDPTYDDWDEDTENGQWEEDFIAKHIDDNF